MRAIIKYPGSKWSLAKWIISHFPEHHSYLEPFFGSGAVLFNNPEVYENAIKTQYDVCEKCKSVMNGRITYELRSRNIAKGDYCLEVVLKSIIDKLNTDRGCEKSL